jgi:hypothetical protein
VQRDDPGQAPVGGRHGRDDLCGKPAVGLAHPVEGRVVVRLGAVVLDDLPPGGDLQRHRLVPQVNRPLLLQRAHARVERLVRDRKRVIAGQVLPQRHPARTGAAEQGLQDIIDLRHRRRGLS